ncbi:MAG: hypothetical protein K6T83_05590, partial [Alicyclobacillus sp.]|nr:hypothetical protein [Alicyclobacillus sp.]
VWILNKLAMQMRILREIRAHGRQDDEKTGQSSAWEGRKWSTYAKTAQSLAEAIDSSDQSPR